MIIANPYGDRELIPFSGSIESSTNLAPPSSSNIAQSNALYSQYAAKKGAKSQYAQQQEGTNIEVAQIHPNQS